MDALSLTDISKIAAWPTAKQDQLTDLIASGREPKVAVRELTPSEPQTANGVNWAFNKFIGQIDRADVALRSNSGNLSFCVEDAEADRKALERGSMLIGVLLHRVDDLIEQCDDARCVACRKLNRDMESQLDTKVGS